MHKELNIEAGNEMEIVEYLLENGLKSIIVSKINNNLISYPNKTFEIIKSWYEPFLEMIKNILLHLKKIYQSLRINLII